MDRIKLGRSGIEAARIGFGGIPIQRLEETRAATLVRRAVQLGYDLFDSARGYSDSEAKIGLGLEGLRDRVVLATKGMARTSSQMGQELQASLECLNTRRIDLYQLHFVDSPETLQAVMAPEGALARLERARQEGQVRAIGVTGHDPETLALAVETGRFDTVQFPCNIVERRALGGLLPLARRRGVGTIAMKPAAGGALQRVDLSLRWILERGVDVLIPGMDSEEQLLENRRAAAPFQPLAEEELAILEAEGRRLGETFCRRCGYCLPCPEGLNIPFLLLLDGYFRRYRCRDWARSRLAELPKRYEDCALCGACEERCPYHLEIRELLAAGGRLFRGEEGPIA